VGTVKTLVCAAALFAVLAISSIINFSNLGASSLFSDEAIYAVSAHNAVAHGQWYPSVYQHAPYSWKPPLAVWPVAASFSMFGESAFSDRAPSAFLGVLDAGILFVCASWMLGPAYGFLAAMLLATSPAWLAWHGWHGPRQGVTEPLFCLCLMAALVFYQKYRDVRARKWLLAACVAAACSGLCKGLVGPVFLFFATAANEWSRRREERGKQGADSGRTVLSALQVPALLLLGGISLYLPWALDNALRDPGFLAQMYRDVVVRLVHGLEPAHVSGPLFYPQLLVDAFGWPGLLVMAVGLAVALLQPPQNDRARALRLTALWALIVLAVASCSVSKLPWYVTPALPALAVMIAAGTRALVARIAIDRRLAMLAVAAIGVTLGDRVWAAWNSTQVAYTPRKIQMQALAQAIRRMPEARFYSDNFDKAPTPSLAGWNMYFREWNEYYLEQIEYRVQAIPDRLPADGCDVVLTDRAGELLRRPGFADAQVIPITRYDEREGHFAVLDRCNGRIEAELRAP